MRSISAIPLLCFLFLFHFCSCTTPEFKNKEAEEAHDFDKKSPVIFDVIKIRPEPRIETFWSGSMPDFIICEASGLTRSRAYQGVSYWKKLGYPILNIRHVRDSPECRTDYEKGKVVVKLINNSIPINQNLAVTKVYYHRETRVIQGASIYLIGGYANKPRLIEHEIGHALGWKHYPRNLHIMHPEYDNTGSSSSGMTYRKYLDLISNFL